MRLTLLHSRLGLRNSATRLPFRYGAACLTQCPQATLEAVIQVAGHTQAGYSGDCLPPGWFDKSVDKDYRQQVTELLEAIATAQQVFEDVFSPPASLFDGWREAAAGAATGQAAKPAGTTGQLWLEPAGTSDD